MQAAVEMDMCAYACMYVCCVRIIQRTPATIASQAILQYPSHIDDFPFCPRMYNQISITNTLHFFQMDFNFPDVDKHSVRLYIVNFNIILPLMKICSFNVKLNKCHY